jgi:small subunit ribosomal protein S6
MTEYETTVILKPDLGGDAVEGALDKVREVVKTGGGKLLAINHWGKKKLAYEINKQTRGIYVHTHYLGGNTLVSELERNLRISEPVVRFMTVKMAENVSDSAREEVAYVRPEYDAQEEEETQQAAAPEATEAPKVEEPKADEPKAEKSEETNTKEEASNE